jgi:LPXTG-site transpeptidase (sortase) family protein
VTDGRADGTGRGRHLNRWPAGLGLVRGRVAGAALCAALGAGLTVVAVSAWPAGGGDGPGSQTGPVAAPAAAELTGAEPDPPAPFVAEPPVEIEAAGGPQPARPAPAAGPPTRLVVPELGVDAPVVGIHAVDGVLLPPDDPQTLGWWSDGAAPGAERGGALVTGHTVHSGGGALDDLETLEVGDDVRVRTAAGTLDYLVAGVTVYDKGRLARDAARVFSQEVPGRLVLITCEDWNGSGYDSNVVVLAEPVA